MKRPSSATQPTHQSFSLIVWAMILSLFALLALGSLVLQKQLRQAYDVRSEATTPSGPVILAVATQTLSLGSESSVDLTIDTKQTQISGVQVALEIKTVDQSQVFGSNFTYQVTNPQLRLADWDGEAITAPGSNAVIGYRYVFMILPTVPASPFGTAGIEPLLSIRFIPSATSDYHVSFDGAKTLATAYLSANQDVLAPLTTAVLQVTTDDCTYTYGAWSSCQNGKQVRSYTASLSSCPAPQASQLEQTCLPQCSYTYSNWGECVNGWQNRTMSTTPASCTWYTAATPEELSRACQTSTTINLPELYTYEACWNDKTVGNSAYVIWDTTKFPNVTAVDVSMYSDFREFAHKSVTGATSVVDPNRLATDLTNFRTYTDGKQTLYTFYPEVYYYFRLYNGQHSGVARFYVPKCAGIGGVNYKQCNEVCTSNAECAVNLTCTNGQCRRAGNVDSTICVLPPDQGLQRSCNEYCADNKECASGLTCWYNRCRSPKNLADTSCKINAKAPVRYLVTTTATDPQEKGDEVSGVEGSCNEVCAANRDCAIGLRCYANRCRLPANLESSICSATELGETQPELTPQSSLSATINNPPTTSTQTDSQTPSEATTANHWLSAWLPRLPYILGGLVLLIVAILLVPALLRSNQPTTTVYQHSTLSDLQQQRSSAVSANSPTRPTPPAVPGQTTSSMIDRLKQRGVQPPGI